MRLPARRRSRILLAGTLAGLVVAASGGAWLLTRDSSEAAASSTAQVTNQTVRETVSATGTVAARRTRDESFAVSGTVTKVRVHEGDKVRKGEVLATVGKAALVASRQAAATSLDAAITQLSEDTDSGAGDVQLAADQTAVVAARATLADAKDAVTNATLRATIAGTVTSVGISKGDAVGSSSGSSGGGASPTTSTDTSSTADTSSGTISIVSTGSYVVDATVAAADVDQVKKGLQAEVTATGVTDTIYGTVTSVGLVAQTNDSGAAVFPVTITVTGKQKDLYAGVSATATIVVKQRPDVLTVPSRALSTVNGATHVTKVVDGKKVDTEVKTGETYGMTTEVVSGLAEGDSVVVPGFQRPTGSGSGGNGGGEGGFPGGGQMPDFSQMGGGGQPPMGAPGQ